MTVIKLVTALVVGFSFGFFLGILFLDSIKKQQLIPRKSKIVRPLPCAEETRKQSYDSWLASQGIRKVPIDIDEYVHGEKSGQRILESEWLRKQVHITCVIFVERGKNIQAALLTWVKHCNSYFLFHAKKPHDIRAESFDSQLGIITIKSTSSWHFLCNSVRYLWENMNSQMQWFLFVKDDVFVVPENLRYIVARLDFNSPFYLGHSLALWGQPYNLAQAGYVLSKGSIALLVSNYSTSESCQKGGKYWKKEDFYLGKNLEKLCVLPMDTRDRLLKGRFHGYNLNQLLFENKLASIAPYWKSSQFPTTQGKNCCSETSVTFQGIEADKIYMYDYIINHMHVYTHGMYGNRPAPTPYPPEKVWQQFLLDRGFSNVRNASAKLYLDAWKDKISEDLNNGKLKKKKSKWQNNPLIRKEGHGEIFPVPLQVESDLDTKRAP